MSQQDFDVATGDANTGITFRAAVNAALQALASMNSGASAPTVAYPFQVFINTSESPNGAYIRNAANTVWVKFGYIDAGTGKLMVFNADTATNATNATNADTVDNYHAASLLARGNHTGTQDGGTITGTVPTATNATNATNADTVDGYHAGSFSFVGHGHSGVELTDGTVTLAKLKMAQGSWSISVNAPNGTYDIAIGRNSHLPRIAATWGANIGYGLLDYDGAYITYPTSGTFDCIRMIVSTGNTGGTFMTTLSAYWDYHTN